MTLRDGSIFYREEVEAIAAENAQLTETILANERVRDRRDANNEDTIRSQAKVIEGQREEVVRLRNLLAGVSAIRADGHPDDCECLCCRTFNQLWDEHIAKNATAEGPASS